MSTITISKREYQELLDRKLRYDYLRQILEEDIFSPPPLKDVKAIVKAFQATKIYNSRFIKNLEKGLRRSAYF